MLRPALTLALAGLLLAETGGYGPPKLLANLEDAEITESSGLAVSRRNPGLFWTHNDSGDGPFVYLFDRQGRKHGKWRVPNAQAIDWEDMAFGQNSLYLGDIGDNDRTRATVVVYRIPEPSAPQTPSAKTLDSEPAQVFRFRYPDGPHNAEALLAHPKTGELYIVTKAQGQDRETIVYKAPMPLVSGKTVTLRQIALLHMPGEADITLFIGRITGGAISPDGRRVALCDYLHGYEAELPAGEATFDAIWKQPFRTIDLGQRKQGESLTYGLDGAALYATSEGRPCPLIEIRRLEH